ncbi:MAG: four helix bundle protein [Ignavibacteriales bacterium CG12_big_fil_rev_8_21_14_0_65_30_8]|nr:MAG: four helix bundle protein [Ignavibacteriales bacterium CG12_big_fil_rev_8_21_14_0_65_30_8]
MIKLNHKNLDVWKKSIELISEVYAITQSFPKDELFGLTSQIRRASVSIASNIAEGFARTSKVETVRFLDISRSSLVEVDTQIEIATKLKYIKLENLDEFSEKSNHIFAMLSNLIKKLKENEKN